MAIPSTAAPSILKALSAFVIYNGLQTIRLGVRDYNLDPRSPITAILDSQIRYYGAFTAGFGAVGWWTSTLRSSSSDRNAVLVVLGATVMLTGLARAVSARVYGFGEAWTRRAMWTELLAPGLLWLVVDWS